MSNLLDLVNKNSTAKATGNADSSPGDKRHISGRKCEYVTSAGTLCKNKAKPGDRFCTAHLDKMRNDAEAAANVKTALHKKINERYIFHGFNLDGVDMNDTSISFSQSKDARSYAAWEYFMSNGYTIHSFALDTKLRKILTLFEKTG